ncbi:hypothetical protein [Streptomyces chumphonensis]|uniref:hypothetical protein n=1 Tax=Streptomyces chumphonensis TaxID=1214925 RepID=UPI003D74610C
MNEADSGLVLGVALLASLVGSGVRCLGPPPPVRPMERLCAGEAERFADLCREVAVAHMEWSKHSTYGWFGPDDLPRLKENRAPGEYLIAKALRDRPGTS